jgi:hypothetical protein
MYTSQKSTARRCARRILRKKNVCQSFPRAFGLCCAHAGKYCGRPTSAKMRKTPWGEFCASWMKPDENRFGSFVMVCGGILDM